ncbi:MAG: flagellar assembly peptidoglycan hydrolase FlgJ [Chromatiaceae bacterium]|nr:flagellar assembly peptidoglycan hydrolase FlgJ [Chromatiaceae bacterium]
MQPLNGGLAFDPSSLSPVARQARKGDLAGLEAAARGFESLLLGQMVKQMREVSFGDGLFDSEHSKLYREMLDQQLAQSLSEGQGLGIREALMRQLGPTVGGASASGADPERSPERLMVMPERNPWLGRARPSAEVQAAKSDSVAESASGASETSTVSTRSPAPPSRWPPANPEEFVAVLRPHAEQAAARLGVDPDLLLAQSALESGWGRHVPRREDGASSFNLFGIKAHGGWEGDRVAVGTLEYRQGVARRERAEFRAYASPADSFNDYVDFLERNPRYREALTQRDSADFIRGLQRAGYATDPNYAAKVLDIHQRLRGIGAQAEASAQVLGVGVDTSNKAT